MTSWSRTLNSFLGVNRIRTVLSGVVAIHSLPSFLISLMKTLHFGKLAGSTRYAYTSSGRRLMDMLTVRDSVIMNFPFA